MSLITKIAATPTETITSGALYLFAELVVQSMFLIVLLEIISVRKLNMNKKFVFIISSIVCSAISIIININNAYTESANSQVSAYETFIIWTMVFALIAIASTKSSSSQKWNLD